MSTELTPIVGPQALPGTTQKSLLTIQKATVKKQLLAAEFSEQLDLQNKPREFTMQGTELVHPALERCFARLVPHFCLLTEQLSESADFWPSDEATEPMHEHFDSYGVTGLIIGKKDGVPLMGFRQLESGKVLNLTGQYVSFAGQSEEFEESDAWHYPHTDNLKTLVEEALAEIDAALRGKCNEAGRQLDMFRQQNDDQEQLKEQVISELSEVAAAAAPKRKARRKQAE